MFFKAIKGILIFIILTASSCGITASLAPRMSDGGLNLWYGVPVTIVVWIVWSVISPRIRGRHFSKKIIDIMVSPDYVYQVEKTGFAIDIKNKKIAVILIDKNHILDFSNITSVRCENSPFGPLLHIDTSDFNNPSLAISALDSERRDAAYQKLRVALGYS